MNNESNLWRITDYLRQLRPGMPAEERERLAAVDTLIDAGNLLRVVPADYAPSRSDS